MKKGEIWNVQFPPGYGYEQAGERPAIILTDNITTAVIIPFTSNIQALPSSEVKLFKALDLISGYARTL